MCGVCLCIFLLIIFFNLLSYLVYLNFEIVLVLFMYLIIYTTVSIKYNKDYIVKNAQKILVGFYKVEKNTRIKTIELYFKNNGTCDVLYNNIPDNKWWEHNHILRKNIPYRIYKNKVYLEFDEYDKRTFCINKNYLTETRNKVLVKYHKITYNESELFSFSRNKRIECIKRIDFKNKVNKTQIEDEYNATPKVIEKNKTTPETKKEPKSKTKRTIKKKDISPKNIKTDKETKKKTKKTESKKNTISTKPKKNKKDTLVKRKKDVIELTPKDLELIIANQKNTSNSYVVEYLNEKNFRQKERGIKKYNMLAYKKLIFEYYPSFREGNFNGTIVSQNINEGITKYKLKLPTDSMFSKVYDDITVYYTVYENQKKVILNNITPDDILTEVHKKELTAYKGVPISKSHAEKDMFKINLLNMLDK